MELAAQIIGLVAAAFNIYAFQMKGNKYLYLLRAIGGTLFAISFFLKGAPTAALLNLACLLQGAILAVGPKWTNRYTLALVLAIFLGVGIFTYDGWLTILITVAQLVGAVAMFSRNGRVIRLSNFFFVSPIWLVNNILVFSLGGIITEGVTLVSILISFLRFGWNGFEDRETEKHT